MPKSIVEYGASKSLRMFPKTKTEMELAIPEPTVFDIPAKGRSGRKRGII